MHPITPNNSPINKQLRYSSFTLIVAFICLSLIGLALVPLLPIKLNPSRELPGFTVYFNMPNTSARVIEMQVTSKLEAMLARIRGIKNINSTSRNGSGYITVELDKHTDIESVRFEASTIIRQTWSQLPEGVTYPYIRMKMSEDKASRPFMSFTLNAPSTPIIIQQYAEDNIKNRLASIRGIYQINVSGGNPMEWRLEYDNKLLEHMGVTVNDIRQAIALHYQREFLGTCNVEVIPGKKEWIRLALVPTHTENHFAPQQIQVKSINGRIITLDELVKTTYIEAVPQSYYRINGLNSIYLNIVAEESANQLELSKQISEELTLIRSSLPPGYEMHLSYDATKFIQEELDKIYLRTGLTILILLFFILIITRSKRYLLLVTISLSINVAVAVIFYYLFGLEMQLYSLTGITVSLNLIIDNIIVMTDHIMHRRNLKVFLSILAATLTTMGALVIIFFLDEKIRLNLQDFAAVVIINLGVSLFIALFLVPALIDKLKLKKSHSLLPEKLRNSFIKRHSLLSKRVAVRFTWLYARIIKILVKWKIAIIIIFILAFGLPVFMLPDKIEKEEGVWAERYNKTLGSRTYKEKIKPVVDKALGGSLRLFVQKVYEGSYFTQREEVVLSATASLPNGSTLEQMNNLIKRMETYLSGFKEIKQFHTSVYNARSAHIAIRFKKQYENTGFPYELKSNITGKALQLGGGSWQVYGLKDQSFNNNVTESSGSYRIKMYGYNYDELQKWAEHAKELLLSHRRIKEVNINAQFSYYKDDYQEFFFDLNKEKMAREGINAQQLFSAIWPVFGSNMEAGNIPTENGAENIKLFSQQSYEYDVWGLQHFPYTVDGNYYKLSELARVGKGQAPPQIVKENQQYTLCLQYEYIGSGQQGKKIQERDLEQLAKVLPIGYTAETGDYGWYWNKKDKKQYLLLLVIILIIFFITSILFNSLKQPLAIIFVIPISYIGVFMTFYWFKLNFDQGGFAAFVLLCGLTVNASIYVLNEYNSIRKQHPGISLLRAYTKAWNAKVIPIFLTVVSTILGFIPFMIGTDKQSFWFPLAAGTIGGLVMSVIGVYLLLPILTLKKKNVA